MYKLNWILNSFGFLKYLATTLQTDISNFLPSLWSRITKNKDCPRMSLEGTMAGPPHYPDGSRTSGNWTLGLHATVKRGPLLLKTCTSWGCKIQIDSVLPWKMTRWRPLKANSPPKVTGQDLHLQYETLTPFAFLLLAFLVNAQEGNSLTLTTIAQSTAKAMMAQQKSLDFLANVVLHNRIALYHLLAEQSRVWAIANTSCCSWINTSGTVANARNQQTSHLAKTGWCPFR